DGLVMPECHHGGSGVTVIRCGDAHSIELAGHLVEHLAVVLEPLRVGMAAEGLATGLPVDIAECHDRGAGLGDSGYVAVALAADPDRSDPHHVTWRSVSATQHVSGNNVECGPGGHG